jgi:Mg2+/citrate symporter
VIVFEDLGYFDSKIGKIKSSKQKQKQKQKKTFFSTKTQNGPKRSLYLNVCLYLRLVQFLIFNHISTEI